MHCMKCGTKVPEGQVFCDNCLEGMEQYPVRPGTAVNLPKRPQQDTVKKAGAKKKATAEEITARLRRTVIWLTTLVLLLSISLGVAVFLLVERHHAVDPQETIGQNYSTLPPQTPTE